MHAFDCCAVRCDLIQMSESSARNWKWRVIYMQHFLWNRQFSVEIRDLEIVAKEIEVVPTSQQQKKKRENWLKE